MASESSSAFPRVRDSDIPSLAALARTLWTEHYVPIIGQDQVAYMLDHLQSAPAIRAQIEQGRRYHFIGPGIPPAGYLAYDREPDGIFLSKIYVLKTARRQGWARRALAWLVASESPDRIHLTVNRHNPAAIAAYQSLGFIQTGQQIQDIGGGYVMDDFVFEWKPADVFPSAFSCAR